MIGPANTNPGALLTSSQTFLSCACAAVVGLLAIGPADAASFDCAKAASADEAAVCSDPELSALDSEMGGLWFAYDRLPFLMGMRGVRRDEALQFLQDRRACRGEAACLKRTYQSRIDALRKGLVSGMEQFAVEPQATTWPAPVATAMAAYADQCRQLGGSLEKDGDRPNILTGDIDGDGIADYVLDTQSLHCSGSASAFCGNGGCQVDIAVSRMGFKPVSGLGGQPTLTQGPRTAEIALWVSGSNCTDLADDQACWTTYAWQDGKLVERTGARPRPE